MFGLFKKRETVITPEDIEVQPIDFKRKRLAIKHNPRIAHTEPAQREEGKN